MAETGPKYEKLVNSTAPGYDTKPSQETPSLGVAPPGNGACTEESLYVFTDCDFQEMKDHLSSPQTKTKEDKKSHNVRQVSWKWNKLLFSKLNNSFYIVNCSANLNMFSILKFIIVNSNTKFTSSTFLY